MKPITICSQGHVSLRFGATTIHLTLEEFQSFVRHSVLFLEQHKIPSVLENSPLFQKTNSKIH